MNRIQRDPRNDADVRLLLTVFPDLLPDGRRISHVQLETALKLQRSESRYGTVVKKWRAIVFAERRVWLDGRAAEGSGFICLTPDEMVRYSNRVVRSCGRRLQKAIAIAGAPGDSELSEGVRRYRSLLEAATLKIASEHKRLLTDVTRAMAPMQQLPRRAVGA